MRQASEQRVSTFICRTDVFFGQDRLVRSLFDVVLVDLDTRRIVDFRLKPWADRFLVLRAA